MLQSPRGRLLAIFLVLVLSVSAAVWLLQKKRSQNSVPAVNKPVAPAISLSPTAATSPPPPSASPSLEASAPAPSPQVTATEVPAPPPAVEQTQAQPQLTADPGYVGKLNLIIPVSGVKTSQLRDTFTDSRSEGRVHDAIDIPAPQGTPVI